MIATHVFYDIPVIVLDVNEYQTAHIRAVEGKPFRCWGSHAPYHIFYEDEHYCKLGELTPILSDGEEPEVTSEQAEIRGIIEWLDERGDFEAVRDSAMERA